MGDAGDVSINARGSVLFGGISNDGSFRSTAASEVGAEAIGNGGNVKISANSLEVNEGAVISVNTSGNGNAGNVTIDVENGAVFSGTSSDGQFRSAAGSEVSSDAIGNGGSIKIFANSLEVNEGAIISANTIGNGNAGNVTIDVQDTVTFSGTSDDRQFISAASSQVSSGAVGDGGNVQVSADSLAVTDSAQISTATFGTGNAGNVVINVNNSALFDFGDVFVNSEGQGDGGGIHIFANSLSLVNGAQLGASTFGMGDAGDIVIEVKDSAIFTGSSEDGQFISGIASTVSSGAEGDSGDIDISANHLSLIDGANLRTGTFGNGDAGKVSIDSDTLIIEGFLLRGDGRGSPSGIFTINGNLMVFGTGRGGDIQLNTEQLSLSNAAVIDARTFNAQPAGNITIQTSTLKLLQGSQIISASDSSGTAGTISVTANDSVVISGIDANFADRIDLLPGLASFIIPQSNLSVRANANGSAGNVVIDAPFVTLDEQGKIIAESSTADGGNIALNLDNLLVLRNGSQITATAGTEQAGGNGGNIVINSPLIVAIPRENSDINANAFEGNGGRVNITADGVFGIEAQPFPTNFSDITASSEQGISGVVTLNSPDNSFIENNLTDLPNTLINPETLISNSCVVRNQNSSGTFLVTGVDGLPYRPGNGGIVNYATRGIQAIPNNSASAHNSWFAEKNGRTSNSYSDNEIR